MIAFLKLIRLPNLLIIAFTQYMIRFCLMEPILGLPGFELQLPEWEFASLVLATVLISAGGYIINDYFDVRIDAINKPDELVIDKGVKRRMAIVLHAVFSTLGIGAGLLISWRSGVLLSGGALFTLAVAGLWFYSTSFKYHFLTGNLVVSFLTAAVPFMPILFETPRLIHAYHRDLLLQLYQYGFGSTTTLLLWGGAYAAFAFLLSMIREMIKDMEDIPGDKEYGCRTLPIVWGVSRSKALVLGLIILTMAGVGYCQAYLHGQLRHPAHLIYLIAGVQLPLVLAAIRTWTATDKKHFHMASILIKFTMLGGICYLLLFRYMVL